MAATSTSSTCPSPPPGDVGALAEWARGLAEPAAAPRRRPHRGYRDTWLACAGILAAAGGRASARRLGASALGEPLWSLALEPARAAATSPDTVLVVAGLHAMEHIGTAAAVELLARAARPDSPWRERRLVVVPVANPDGFRAVEAALAAGRRGFVRRNARGVDLNRNFAANWRGDYYLHRLLRPLFAPGAGPLSEPETRALDALCAAERPRVAVSLHAFGEWIYTPYAGSRAVPPDAARLLALAAAMAARQPGAPYRIGQLGRRSRLFAAPGAEIDHFYQRHGALSFLVEIRGRAARPRPGRLARPLPLVHAGAGGPGRRPGPRAARAGAPGGGDPLKQTAALVR